MFSRTTKGFTLLEVLLSISLLAIVVGVSAPVLQQVQTTRKVDIEVDQLFAFNRRAQVLARSGYHDDDWGIDIDGNSMILFKGNDFSSRDADFDEIIVFTNITIDTPEEYFFEKNTGLPGTAITLDFTTTLNYPLTITINDQGVII